MPFLRITNANHNHNHIRITLFNLVWPQRPFSNDGNGGAGRPLWLAIYFNCLWGVQLWHKGNKNLYKKVKNMPIIYKVIYPLSNPDTMQSFWTQPKNVILFTIPKSLLNIKIFDILYFPRHKSVNCWLVCIIEGFWRAGEVIGEEKRLHCRC